MASPAMRFAATIQIDGINPYVDVPPKVVAALGGGPKIPVLMKIAAVKKAARRRRGLATRDAAQLEAVQRRTADGWTRANALSRRDDFSRLYLDQWIRDEAGVDVGDRVRVALKADAAPRAIAMPPSFEAALAADANALAAWEALTPSRRKEMLSYLAFLKTPAALSRNVAKAIAQLKRG